MNRRDFLLKSVAAFLAPSLAPEKLVQASAACSKLPLPKISYSVKNNDTLAEAALNLFDFACIAMSRKAKGDALTQRDVDFYAGVIAQNPHSKTILTNYSPGDIFNACRYIAESWGVLDRQEMILSEVLNLHRRALEIPAQLEGAELERNQDSAPQAVASLGCSTVNFLHIEPFDMKVARDSALEFDGGGFFYR